MMGQDNITWTGARAPGVEQHRLLAWRCSTEQVISGTERKNSCCCGEHEGWRQTYFTQRKSGEKANPKRDQERLHLTGQLWSRTEGKPAVRNLRGDDGNGGIIRSPQRATVLPARSRY